MRNRRKPHRHFFDTAALFFETCISSVPVLRWSSSVRISLYLVSNTTINRKCRKTQTNFTFLHKTVKNHHISIVSCRYVFDGHAIPQEFFMKLLYAEDERALSEAVHPDVPSVFFQITEQSEYAADHRQRL